MTVCGEKVCCISSQDGDSGSNMAMDFCVLAGQKGLLHPAGIQKSCL